VMKFLNFIGVIHLRKPWFTSPSILSGSVSPFTI
jgi:hypothetical protein